MSILLEALKKSESQRQLGQTPGIHSTVDPPAADETAEQQWIPLTMLALSAIAIAWFGWQQYREPAMLPQSTPMATSPAAGEIQQPVLAGDNREQERTPVESYQADSGSAQVIATDPAINPQDSQERKQDLNRSFTNYEAPDEPEPEEQSQSLQPSIAVNPPASASADATSATGSRQRSVANNQSGRASRVTPSSSEPISFWQVPQALRDGLPEMRITVLVYAEAPEDRFVLINGQRLLEKEELVSGVILDEIRRDGAVFRYRNYRFLVKG